MRLNYYGIWKNFNDFFIKLDIKPNNWEDRLVLYTAFLIINNRKSSMVKSYISAIKAVLYNGGVKICEDTTLLSSLTKACNLKNDTVLCTHTHQEKLSPSALNCVNGDVRDSTKPFHTL